MRVLVVDGANVVGSRPDGWWRDRAGAARRLHDRLVAADLAADEVVLVLEGRARPGQPEGSDGAVVTRHAPGEGDDEIVDVCEEHAGAEVTVVSADRGLRARVEAVGASVVGPGWLLELCQAGSMSDDGEFWFCTKHHRVERSGDGCTVNDRLGPYATEAEAARALDKVAERNREWDEDDEWGED